MVFNNYFLLRNIMKIKKIIYILLILLILFIIYFIINKKKIYIEDFKTFGGDLLQPFNDKTSKNNNKDFVTNYTKPDSNNCQTTTGSKEEICINSCPDGWIKKKEICEAPENYNGWCKKNIDFKDYSVADRKYWSKYCNIDWTSCNYIGLCKKNKIKFDRLYNINYNTPIYIVNNSNELYLGSCGISKICEVSGDYAVQTMVNDSNGYMTNSNDWMRWIFLKHSDLDRKEIHYNDIVYISIEANTGYALGICDKINCNGNETNNITLQKKANKYSISSHQKWKLISPSYSKYGPVQFNEKITLQAYDETYLGMCDIKTECLKNPSIKFSVNSTGYNIKNSVWKIIKNIKLPEQSPPIDLNDYIVFKYNLKFCIKPLYTYPRKETPICLGLHSKDGRPSGDEWLFINGRILLKKKRELCISIKNNKIKKGQSLVLDNINEDNNIYQKWFIDKYYIIRLNSRPELCFTVKKDEVKYESLIVIDTYSSRDKNDNYKLSQKWLVSKNKKISKCDSNKTWFKPYYKNYLKPNKYNEIIMTYNNFPEILCHLKCKENTRCDFYTINEMRDQCNLYKAEKKESNISYNWEPFQGIKNHGLIKNSSICNKGIRLNKETNRIKDSLCKVCAFDQFKNTCHNKKKTKKNLSKLNQNSKLYIIQGDMIKSFVREYIDEEPAIENLLQQYNIGGALYDTVRTYANRILRTRDSRGKVAANAEIETIKQELGEDNKGIPSGDNEGDSIFFDCNVQKCCPKGWFNNRYGAEKGVSCGTNNIKSENTISVSPITSCINAGGEFKITNIQPPRYLCLNKNNTNIKKIQH